MTELAAHPAPVSVVRRRMSQRLSDPAPPHALLLITAVVEAMMGRRALHQLRPYLASDAFCRLVEYVDDGGFRRTVIGGIRVQMPTATAVEACVRLASASRWLSCVMRLDDDESRWRCTDLLVLRPQPS